MALPQARGRFLAQQPVADMTAHAAARFVRVRSPELEKLRAMLDEQGAKTGYEDGALTARGMGRGGDRGLGGEPSGHRVIRRRGR